MRVFITGTDTDIGKTLVASWLCLHTGYDYFKPIQTGSLESSDSNTVSALSKANIHKESYVFDNPLSPHMAAQDEERYIDLNQIKLPHSNNLIVEGAGGILVPINDESFIADLIACLKLPVILVARSGLGTINHTLLSLDYIRKRRIEILGVIMSGEINPRNKESIQRYGKVDVLAEIPYLETVCFEKLREIPLTSKLKLLFEAKK